VTVIVPLGGFSLLSSEGGPFFDPVADGAFLETLRHELAQPHRIVEVDAPINSDAVAESIMKEVRSWGGVAIA
jgi:uncharacterized protein (UPF0261 family)